jgi:type IV fimbrial biogenesis protein FimT
LQNGLRLAQSEAVRQSRQVVFGLTNEAPGQGAVTAVDGINWSAQIVPNATEAARADLFVRGGPMTDTTGGVAIRGPQYSNGEVHSAVCFSSLGNLVANATPAPAATGATCGASAVRYDVSHPNGDRPLRVLLSLGGRVRMCDPARPTGTPDGC